MKKNLYKKVTISLAILVTSLLWFNCANVSAVPIPGLFNTGVDDSGNSLTYGLVDSHYIMTGKQNTAYSISSTLYHPLTTPQKYYPDWWAHPLANSNWIGPLGGNTWDKSTYGDLLGDYYYELTFDLTGLDPDTAWITGTWAHDNYSTILLNGVNLNIHNPSQFWNLQSFAINSGFIAGLNHLAFLVQNVDTLNFPEETSPTGLLVQIQGEATPVPEPSTLLFLGMGLLGLAGMGRKWIQKK